MAQQPMGAGIPQPRLLTIMPMGGKAGTTVEMILTGSDIEEPEGIAFSQVTIKGELLPDAPPQPDPKDPNKGKGKGKVAGPTTAVKYKVTIPPDVPVGIHDVRIFNKYGVSNPRAFVIGDQTEVLEVEPNNDVAQAQKVELNTTINGAINAPTDVDYFKFTGKKGQRVIISCLASSIDSRLTPSIELYDSSGKRLASNRDYHDHDALIDQVLAADGEYFVRLYQFTYTLGGPEYFYRLSISTAPWIDAIFPSVVEPGKQAQLTIFGRNLPGGQPDPTAVLNGSVLEKATVSVNVPNDPLIKQRLSYSGYVAPPGSRIDGFEYRVKNPSGSSNPFLLTYARASVVLENPANTQREAAQAVNVPCEIAGRLDNKHRLGWFAFSAKKGDVLSIDVQSDRIGSPTHLVMRIYNADTKAMIAEVEDDPETLSPNHFFTKSTDPGRYRLVVAADGKFELLIKSQDSTDLGPRHYYQVRITPEQPDFRLVMIPTSTFLPEGTVLGQGGNLEMTVYVWRLDNFGGDVTLSAEGLPPGVMCKPQTVNPGVKVGSLVLSAAPDANPWVGEVKIKGTATINGQPVVREARSASIIWPNPPQQPNVPTFTRLDRGMVLAVREKAPFGLTAESEKTAVLAGDKLNVKLKLDRNWADFKAPVQVAAVIPGAVPNQPPANQPITSAAVTIAADKTEGAAVVDFKANVPPGNYTIVFRGTGQVPFAKDPMAKQKANVAAVLPSTPLLVTVLPKQVATVTLTPPNSTGKIGGQSEVMVKVARMFDYAGEFKVQLVLPANAKGITADEITIPAGKDEAKLVINVAGDAPVANVQGIVVKAVAIVGKDHQTVQEAKFNLNVVK
jgi:hypothetical protein